MTRQQQLAKVQHNKYFFESRLIANPNDEALKVKVAEIRAEEERIKRELGRWYEKND